MTDPEQARQESPRDDASKNDGKHERYLVTGGAGFIGSHMVELLRRERPDANLRVLDNFVTGRMDNVRHLLEDGRVELIRDTINNRPGLDKAMEGVDCVFHFAALASVPRSMANPLETDIANSHGTLLLLDAARRANAKRFVYAGSSSAYGDQPEPAKREAMRADPLSIYAATKLAGEHYVRAHAATWGMKTITTRFFNVFGPRQSPNSQYAAVIPRFIARMLRGEKPTIYGDGLQSRDFTYVANVCAGALAAAEAPDDVADGRALNVASGDSINLLDLVAKLNDLLGTSIEPKFEPARAGDVKHSKADIAYARASLGYAPGVSFAEGLEKTIAWHRDLLKIDEEEAALSTPIKK
jgi:UDP-glucose 4-epimerase